MLTVCSSKSTSVLFLDYWLSQGSVATYCTWVEICDVYIENFPTNHLVKEFENRSRFAEVIIRHQTAYLFLNTACLAKRAKINNNNYNMRTEPHFSNWTEPNSFQTIQVLFKKRTELKFFKKYSAHTCVESCLRVHIPDLTFAMHFWSTPCSKKVNLTSDNNFGECGLIFKILSPGDS